MSIGTITIGNETRPLEDAGGDWITSQINGRRKDGQTACVRISISMPGANIPFATCTCASAGGGGGGSRPPNAREHELIELWNRHHLDESHFSAGDVVAFVRAVLR
jgi:hypothetical protein